MALTFGQEKDEGGMVKAMVEAVIKGEFEEGSFRIDPAAAMSEALQ